MPIDNGTLFIVNRVQVFLRRHHVNKSPPQPVVSNERRVCHPDVSFLAVTPVELLNSSGGVDNLGLACIERVAGRGDVDVDDGVSIAVLPLDLGGTGDR